MSLYNSVTVKKGSDFVKLEETIRYHEYSMEPPVNGFTEIRGGYDRDVVYYGGTKLTLSTGATTSTGFTEVCINPDNGDVYGLRSGKIYKYVNGSRVSVYDSTTFSYIAPYVYNNRYIALVKIDSGNSVYRFYYYDLNTSTLNTLETTVPTRYEFSSGWNANAFVKMNDKYALIAFYHSASTASKPIFVVDIFNDSSRQISGDWMTQSGRYSGWLFNTFYWYESYSAGGITNEKFHAIDCVNTGTFEEGWNSGLPNTFKNEDNNYYVPCGAMLKYKYSYGMPIYGYWGSDSVVENTYFMIGEAAQLIEDVE